MFKNDTKQTTMRELSMSELDQVGGGAPLVLNVLGTTATFGPSLVVRFPPTSPAITKLIAGIVKLL